MSRNVERFTISLEPELARQFDALIQERGYRNRSEAIRDLLHRELAEARLSGPEESEGIGVLVYVYDHEARDLSRRLTRKQHDGHDLIQATLHVHLDHDRCLESVVLRGGIGRLERLSQSIIAEPGVRHGQLHLVPLRDDQA
ncbi:Nickel-responsive regulator [Candidatus Magnetaquicoccaceae bacterium FCR-1]|uniref:Putative nickel-responsive regulator n=1 Tax=Candidatus Magnetaquiglobus chichijimensis TaxID=3141448 RepID=A0ABQ0C5M1_9PROT